MIILQMDMEQNKIQALVKVGRQIIYMTLLEIVMNLPKKRVAPESELAEEATVAALALTVRLLTVLAFTPTSMLPTPVATVVLALLYI